MTEEFGDSFKKRTEGELANSITKGQIKPKADWRAVDSPKKQTNEFVLFAFLLFMANKTNFFVRFFGRIYGAPNLLLVLSDL